MRNAASDLGVGVVQAGRQLLHGTRGQGADLPQRQGRTSSDARLRVLERLGEQPDDRPADLRQRLGDLIDAALLATEGIEQPGAASGPILPSRNAAWRETPSSFAVKSDSSSGRHGREQRPPPDEQIDHRQPDLLVLVPEVLLEDRQQGVVGQRRVSPAT